MAPDTGPVGDEILMPLAELIGYLADHGQPLAHPPTGLVMAIEQIGMDMPVELKAVVAEDGKVTIMGAAPTQGVATSVMPVFHRLRVTVTHDDGG